MMLCVQRWTPRACSRAGDIVALVVPSWTQGQFGRQHRAAAGLGTVLDSVEMEAHLLSSQSAREQLQEVEAREGIGITCCRRGLGELEHMGVWKAVKQELAPQGERQASGRRGP